MPTVAGQVEHPEKLVTLEVSYKSEGAKIPAYLARPAQSGSYPGILILHDIFGVSDHARDVARRFANMGFAVLVPDGFARVDMATADNAAFGRAGVLDDRQTIADLEGGAALLRSLPYCSGKVGAVGFCMGGRSALLLACGSAKIDATIDCWGGSITRDTGVTPLHPVPVVEMVKSLSKPLYVVCGADDTNPSPAHAAELRGALEREGKLGLVTMESYANAGHAFFADSRPDRYREKAAFELWPKMVAFFNQYLR